jgi:hypothetical protein
MSWSEVAESSAPVNIHQRLLSTPTLAPEHDFQSFQRHEVQLNAFHSGGSLVSTHTTRTHKTLRVKTPPSSLPTANAAARPLELNGVSGNDI